MLVITRKVGTSFTLGEATVHIVEQRGQHIRLAIDAPKGVRIIRDDAKKTEVRA